MNAKERVTGCAAPRGGGPCPLRRERSRLRRRRGTARLRDALQCALARTSGTVGRAPRRDRRRLRQDAGRSGPRPGLGLRARAGHARRQGVQPPADDGPLLLARRERPRGRIQPRSRQHRHLRRQRRADHRRPARPGRPLRRGRVRARSHPPRRRRAGRHPLHHRAFARGRHLPLPADRGHAGIPRAHDHRARVRGRAPSTSTSTAPSPTSRPCSTPASMPS